MYTFFGFAISHTVDSFDCPVKAKLFIKKILRNKELDECDNLGEGEGVPKKKPRRENN